MGQLASSSPRERNAAQTRRAILDTARELFRRNGYAGTTVHSIAERLNLTDPAVYYHFHSKQQLWQELLDDVVVPTPPPEGVQSVAELVDWLLGFFFAYVEHADLMAMLLREQLGTDRASAKYREQVESFYETAAAEPLARLYGERSEVLLQTMTAMLSGMFWDGILTFGAGFRDVACRQSFRERVYRAVALPLGLHCDPVAREPLAPQLSPLASVEPPERIAPAAHPRGRSATRSRILEAAMELFSTNGVDATSIRAIAERCGLTDPAVYYYFPSKAALLDALWEVQTERPSANTAPPEPLTAKGLATLVDAMIDSAATMDSQLRLMIRQVLAGDEVALAMRNESSAQWRTYLVSFLSGSFGETETADRVDAILAATMGAVLLAQMGHPVDFPAYARTSTFREATLAIVTAIVGVPCLPPEQTGFR